MFATPSDLAELRRRIDAIDDRMHDLLIERAELVGEVAANKRGSEVAYYQPGREAEIMRRLAARHWGSLPLATVLRIWRELLAATVRLETAFAVAVYAPSQAAGLWDLARDHYGSYAPISAFASVSEVVRAVDQGSAAVGILPMPQATDPDPWWPRLISLEGKPRVIARLPFGPRGNGRPDGRDALVIGYGAPQETGDDRTLVVIECEEGFSPARSLDQLSCAGLDCTFMARHAAAGGQLILAELAGFIPVSDPRLADFAARLGDALYQLLPLGGYAVPLSMTAPSPDATKG